MQLAVSADRRCNFKLAKEQNVARPQQLMQKA
jgi:hypothetical protein